MSNPLQHMIKIFNRFEQFKPHTIENMLVVVALSTALVIDKLFGIALAALFILKLRNLKQFPIHLNRYDFLFLILLNSYPLVVVLNSYLLKSLEWETLDDPSRFTLISIMYLTFRVGQINLHAIVLGSMLGVIITSVFSLYKTIELNLTRVTAFDSPITFAQIAFMLSLITLTPHIAIFKNPNTQKYWQLALISCTIATCLANQTRSVIVLLPSLLLIFFISHKISTKTVVFGVLTTLGSIVLLSHLNQSDHLFRFKQLGNAASHLQYVLNDGALRKTDTVNEHPDLVRIELWKFGYLLAKEKPVFGHGHNSFKKQFQRITEGRDVSSSAKTLNHAHNDILNLVVELGLLGASSIFLLYLIPSVIAIKKSFCSTATYLILSISISWFILGLTQSQLAHHKITLFQIFILTIAFAYGMNNKFNPVTPRKKTNHNDEYA